MAEAARRVRRDAHFLAQLRSLPPGVAAFQWRAWRLAGRLKDEFAQVSATRPANLAVLLRLARGAGRVVELGTGSAWTAISLVLADDDRVVETYDPIERPERERYLGLVSRRARRRLTFVTAAGVEGPRDRTRVDLLYIDSSHDVQDTILELEAWRPALGEGSLVVFDDFAHPAYPGVELAVRHLRLRGERRGDLFVHRVG